MSKIKDLVGKIVESVKGDKKKLALILFGVFIVCFLVNGYTASNRDAKARQAALDEAQKKHEEASVSTNTGTTTSEDSYLMQVQPDLVKSFGKLPDGYIWNLDGTLLSLGDKSLTAEEVVYNYLNGLRTLDLSMAQKYSRGSIALSTYESYFDSTNPITDYFDSFMRNMYKQALLSIQILGMQDISVFAENKQVFTVKINMLDLTQKDFWENDKLEIYKNLYIYSADEDDSTKGEMYLYDYVLDYYKSGKAKTRDLTVNLTVERYPDLDTGWLVSIDSDINDACSYTDGNLMVKYIMNMFSKEGTRYMQEQREKEEKAKREDSTESSALVN